MVTCEPFVAQSVFKSRPLLLIKSSRLHGVDGQKREAIGLFQTGKPDGISSDLAERKRVKIYRRCQGNKTEIFVNRADDAVRFESLPKGPLILTMDDIYEDVIFSQ